MVVTTLGGYGFAKFQLRAGRAIYLTVLSTLLVPAAAIIISLFLELKQFGPLNSLGGLVLVYIGVGVPFAVVWMRGFFERVLDALGEAARIDGASECDVFWRVMIPLVRPALRRAGVAVPADIAVIGLGDEWIAARTEPPLTTISQNAVQMGIELARLTVAAVEGRQRPRRFLMPTHLVVRATA